jgi:YfiH family protein
MPAGASRGWVWSGGAGGAAAAGTVRVAFAGRGAEPAPGPVPAGKPAPPAQERLLARIAGRKLPVAWARQVHSARVLPAQAGECGEGDALVGRDRGLALAVVTADCVPVLLAGPAGIAAAHAGWRGIAAGIVPATVAALGGEAGETVAWIGPAIGPCCYEVGPEVAAQVAAASEPDVVEPGPAGRPHLDLQEAVRLQLRAAGLRHLHIFRLCTRCQDFRLHSYRRDGQAAGRNHSFIWVA